MSNLIVDGLDDLDISIVSNDDVVIISGEIPTIGIIRVVQPQMVHQVLLSSVEVVEGAKTHLVKEESFMTMPTGDRISLPNFGQQQCLAPMDGQDKRAEHVVTCCNTKEEKSMYISEEQGMFQYLVIPYPSGNERIILAV